MSRLSASQKDAADTGLADHKEDEVAPVRKKRYPMTRGARERRRRQCRQMPAQYRLEPEFGANTIRLSAFHVPPKADRHRTPMTPGLPGPRAAAPPRRGDGLPWMTRGWDAAVPAMGGVVSSGRIHSAGGLLGALKRSAPSGAGATADLRGGFACQVRSPPAAVASGATTRRRPPSHQRSERRQHSSRCECVRPPVGGIGHVWRAAAATPDPESIASRSSVGAWTGTDAGSLRRRSTTRHRRQDP